MSLGLRYHGKMFLCNVSINQIIIIHKAALTNIMICTYSTVQTFQAGVKKCCKINYFYQFTKCKESKQKKSRNKTDIWCYYPLPSNQHQFINFCRIIVRCIINQLYQTGANDHQFHMQVVTQSLTKIETGRGTAKLYYQGEVVEDKFPVTGHTVWQD